MIDVLTRVRRSLPVIERTFWNWHASNWDSLGRSAESQTDLLGRVEWFAGLARKPRARVLDAGCGTGNYALALAERNFDVTGIDFSSKMLERASAKATSVPKIC